MLIAEVLGSQLPTEHVRNLLHKGHIEITGIMGSSAYGIWVAPNDAARATALVEADRKIHPYLYNVHDGIEGKWWLDERLWPVRRFDLDLSKIDKAPQLRADANLRGLFREIATRWKQSPAYDQRAEPYVGEMSLLKIEYMDAKGHLQPGYRADVRVYDHRSNSSFGLSLWSWDQGRKHCS